jgi:hypothetical protein
VTAPFSVVNEDSQAVCANFDPAGNLQVAGNLLVGSLAPLNSGGAGVVELANVTTVPSHATPGGLALYSSGGKLAYASAAGLTNKLAGSQGGVTGTTTVANSNAETVLQTVTIPAGDPVAGSVYHSVAYGVYSWTGTPTLQFNTRWGGLAGTLIAQQPAQTLGTAQTNAHWKVEQYLTFRSATSVQAALQVTLSSSTTTDATTTTFSTPVNPQTVTTSAAADWVLTVTWGAAASANTISLTGGYTEGVA